MPKPTAPPAKPPKPKRLVLASKLPPPKRQRPSSGPRKATVAETKYTALTEMAIEAFLHLVATTGNITKSCEALRINRLTIYHMKQEDEGFRLKLHAAQARGYDAWEDEAARRAFSGHERKVFQQGMLVGTTTEYSDTLATFMLRGAKPEKYREKPGIDLVVKDGATVSLSGLNDEELNALINDKINVLGAGSTTKGKKHS